MSQQKLIEKPGLTITRRLLAAVTTPFLPVIATSVEGEIKVADTNNAACEGILCQEGAAGELVPIVFGGIVPVKIAAAVTRDQMLITSSTGDVYPCPLTSGTTYNILGIARTSSTVAGEFVSVELAKQKLRIKS